MSNEVADGIRGDEAIEVELSDESGFTQIDTANCPPPEQQGEYLQDAEVTAFVDFLKGLLGEGGKLRHAWRHARDGYDWQCEDLLDAARRYHFTVVEEFRVLTGPVDFQSLAANALVLNDLKRRLDAAVSSCNDVDARAVAKDIQLWGGTDIRGKKNSMAIDTLGTASGGFLGYLDRCRNAFGGGWSLDLSPFIGASQGLRSNAGFTKIYSLSFDDFIIYDSRVAAALGLLVIRWWALTCYRRKIIAPIPAHLRFYCMPTHGHVNRDPNVNRFTIAGLPTTRCDLSHVQSNVHANWLLCHALSGSYFEHEVLTRPHPYPVKPLRALEAALFMIGYDLAANWPHG